MALSITPFTIEEEPEKSSFLNLHNDHTIEFQIIERSPLNLDLVSNSLNKRKGVTRSLGRTKYHTNHLKNYILDKINSKTNKNLTLTTIYTMGTRHPLDPITPYA